MLDALIVTIGILGMLVSVATKFAKASVDGELEQNIVNDQSNSKVATMPSSQSDRAQQLTRK